MRKLGTFTDTKSKTKQLSTKSDTDTNVDKKNQLKVDKVKDQQKCR